MILKKKQIQAYLCLALKPPKHTSHHFSPDRRGNGKSSGSHGIIPRSSLHPWRKWSWFRHCSKPSPWCQPHWAATSCILFLLKQSWRSAQRYPDRRKPINNNNNKNETKNNESYISKCKTREIRDENETKPKRR